MTESATSVRAKELFLHADLRPNLNEAEAKALHLRVAREQKRRINFFRCHAPGPFPGDGRSHF